MKTNLITTEQVTGTAGNAAAIDQQNMHLNNSKAYRQIENSINSALETYSNVHRGSGHFSG